MNQPLTRFVEWLRAGYPTGIPTDDYLPIFALLRRQISDDEIDDVVSDLIEGGVLPADRVDIGVLVVRATNRMPTENDLRRVRDRLEAVGWPVSTGSPDEMGVFEQEEPGC